DHSLHLRLLGASVTADGLLHPRRGVFRTLHAGASRRDEHCAAGLPDGERGTGLDADERLLEHHGIRGLPPPELGHAVFNRPQAAASGPRERAAVVSARTRPPFSVHKIGQPVVKRTGTAWKVSLRFTASAPASAFLVVKRGDERVQTFRFASGTGIITVGPFV